MEPFAFIIQAIAAAALSAIPAAPSTVPGTVDMVNVSNTSIISQTADKLTADKKAADKVASEVATKAEQEKTEKAAEDKKAETAKTAEKEKLQLPLKAGSYSYVSDFGLRCAPVTGAGNFHYGMDLAAPFGTPMFSIADGTVVSVTDGAGAIGGDVRIESTVNGKLMTFRYHHMENSSKYVKVGDEIKAGHHISDVASTGMSTGAHLHLEVFEGKFSDNKHIDPEEYFKDIGLEIVKSAKANYVNKSDHPTSCPGGDFSANPSVPLAVASAPQPNQPAAPSAPAKTAPATPAAPAAPVQIPTHTPVPRPTPTPTPVPVKPSPSPSPSAIPSPTPSSSVKVTIPPLVNVEVPLP